ncbi:MAG: thioredoxin family protein [Pirellulales bacterium]
MSAQPFPQTRALAIAVFLMGLLLPRLAKAEPSATPATGKTEREPIYDEEADGEKLIAEAICRAKAEGKRVLIEWGGNWCGWCHKLHDVFKTDELIPSRITTIHPIRLAPSCTTRVISARS